MLRAALLVSALDVMAFRAHLLNRGRAVELIRTASRAAARFDTRFHSLRLLSLLSGNMREDEEWKGGEQGTGCLLRQDARRFDITVPLLRPRVGISEKRSHEQIRKVNGRTSPPRLRRRPPRARKPRPPRQRRRRGQFPGVRHFARCVRAVCRRGSALVSRSCRSRDRRALEARNIR